MEVRSSRRVRLSRLAVAVRIHSWRHHRTRHRAILKILVPCNRATFAHQRDSDRLLWAVESEIAQDGFGCLFHHFEGLFRLLILPQRSEEHTSELQSQSNL